VHHFNKKALSLGLRLFFIMAQQNDTVQSSQKSSLQASGNSPTSLQRAKAHFIKVDSTLKTAIMKAQKIHRFILASVK